MIYKSFITKFNAYYIYVYKRLEFKKRSRNLNKSRQTSNQLEPVTRNIFYLGYTVITQSQMHVQIKHSLAHLQDLISTLAGIQYIFSDNTSQRRD